MTLVKSTFRDKNRRCYGVRLRPHDVSPRFWNDQGVEDRPPDDVLTLLEDGAVGETVMFDGGSIRLGDAEARGANPAYPL